MGPYNCLGDELLPSYVGINFKGPYSTTGSVQWNVYGSTPPKTNMEPENELHEEEIPIKNSSF